MAWGACNKADEIGSGILPDGDIPGLVFTDTVSIMNFCLPDDSIKSGGVTNKSFLTTVNPIGALNDATFGISTAGLYAQLDLSKTSFDFGTDLAADSLVLTLAIKEYFGDTATPVTFHVWRLTQKISSDSTYYTSKDNFNYVLQEIGSATVILTPRDSTTEYGIKKAPHVRIRLNQDLVNEFAGKTQTNELKKNDDFVNYFNGIYITADAPATVGSGYIFTLDYKSAMSRMALYYKHTTLNDTGVFNFTFNDYNRVNRLKHDFTGTPVGLQLADSTAGNEYTYVQSLGSVQAKIKFPFLKQFGQSRQVAINKAQLIFQADNSEAPKYSVHKTMVVLTADGANKGTDKFKIIPATFDSTKSQYIADVTVYAQQVINGKHDDYGLILKGSGALVNAYRTKLYGFQNPDKRMKLKLYYTQY